MTMFNKTKNPQSSTSASQVKGSDAPGRRKAAHGTSETTSPSSSTDVLAEGTRRRLAARSLLSTQLEFEGNLKFKGTTTVDCVFRGNIDTKDTLIVGSSARIEGEVHAGVVEISGTVTGNIWATETVKIHTGSEVTGDIETPTISMEEGVSFAGRCTRPPKQASKGGQSKQPESPKAEPKEKSTRELEPVGASTGPSFNQGSNARSADDDDSSPGSKSSD